MHARGNIYARILFFTSMINEEAKLQQYIKKHNIPGEHKHYSKTLHSVQDLLQATGLPLEQISKTMIFIAEDGSTIAALVPAMFRVSSSKLAAALEQSVRFATPEEVYERTGYPIGGMPCFGFECTLLADPRIFEQEYIYTGGGSEFSITKLPTSEIKKWAIIKKIRGKKSN